MPQFGLSKLRFPAFGQLSDATWMNVVVTNELETSCIAHWNRNVANYKVKSKKRGKGNEHLDAAYKSLHILQIAAIAAVCCLVAKSCPTVTTPWTVAHQAPLSMGFFQARMLEWVAIFCSRESSWPRNQTQVSWPRNQTQVSCLAVGFFTVWTTRKAHIPDYFRHLTQERKVLNMISITNLELLSRKILLTTRMFHC